MSRKKSDDVFSSMRNQLKEINNNKGCQLFTTEEIEEVGYSSIGSRTSYEPSTTYFINDVTTEYTEVLIENKTSQLSTFSYGVERISDGNIYYQSTKGETISATTNQAGTIQEVYEYSDCGLEQQLGYGYNGERRDATGLIYLRNRTYDPTTGRFIQLDTYLGEKDSVITQNRTIAFNNNPYKYVDKGGNKAISIADEYNEPWQPPYKPQIGVINNGCPVSFNSKPTSGNSDRTTKGYNSLESVFGDYKNGYKNCYIKPKPVEVKKMSQWDLAWQGLGRLGEGLVRTVVGGVVTVSGVGAVAGGNPVGIPAILGGGTQITFGFGMIIGGTVDLWNAITNHTDDKGLDPIKDIVLKDQPEAYQIIDLLSLVAMGVGSYFSIKAILTDPGKYPAAAEFINKYLGIALLGDQKYALTWKENKIVTADDIKYSDKFSLKDYVTQVSDRGGSNQKIADAINNPYKIGDSINTFTGNPVKVYYINDIHYVAIDSVTNKVIQVSDLEKVKWVFDLSK